MSVIHIPKPGAPNYALRTQRLRIDRNQTEVAEQTAGVRRVNDRRVLSGIFWILRLSRAELDRTLLQQNQTMSACRNPI
jgi:hypothetical protein